MRRLSHKTLLLLLTFSFLNIQNVYAGRSTRDEFRKDNERKPAVNFARTDPKESSFKLSRVSRKHPVREFLGKPLTKKAIANLLSGSQGYASSVANPFINNVSPDPCPLDECNTLTITGGNFEHIKLYVKVKDLQTGQESQIFEYPLFQKVNSETLSLSFDVKSAVDFSATFFVHDYFNKLPSNAYTVSFLKNTPVTSDISYTYGAKFEPPNGRVVHGMGQWMNYNTKFVAALPADKSVHPASELLFLALADTERPWSQTTTMLASHLLDYDANGIIPHVDIALRGNKLLKSEIEQLSDPLYGIDDDIVNSTEYDSKINDLADIIKAFGKPVMVRIGGEFSGNWNGYHPWDYPKAFRKIVNMFRDKGADNAAFIWCYEPAAPGDFAEQNLSGEYKWFPEDDVIDWYSIDIFNVKDFTGITEKSGIKSTHGKTVDFLNMAKDHNRPVIIAESSASLVEITSDAADGQADWDAWFTPYFAFMNDHPEIKWFHYVSVDWKISSADVDNGWKDADLTKNMDVIMPNFINELKNPKYLHTEERYLLNNYMDYP